MFKRKACCEAKKYSHIGSFETGVFKRRVKNKDCGKKTGVSALGAFSIIVPVFNYFFSLPALNYSRCAIAHYQNSLVHF